MASPYRLIAALLLAGALAACAHAPPPAAGTDPREAERQARLQMAQTALDKLYQVHPDARGVVEGAVGYAVFEVNAIYAVLLVGQRGKGVLFDNATKAPTFMIATRAGTGPGIGQQKVYQVFAFKSRFAMDQFVMAGDAGADVAASVSTGTGGFVRSFNPSIEIFEVPESGVALQASWGGTVYTVDTELQSSR